MKKRIALFSIYSKTSVIEKYVIHYLQELRSVTDKIYIAINGIMDETELKKVEPYADLLIMRENEGYDAGAYKEIFEKHLRMDELAEFDEIILSNDTCIGPFVPFTHIFDKMESEDIDFWGISHVDHGIFKFVVSNFMVFRKTAYFALLKVMNDIPNGHLKLKDIYTNFEMAMTYRLEENRLRWKTYVDPPIANFYKYPEFCLFKQGFPFLKCRFFTENYYSQTKYEYILKNLCGVSEYVLEGIREFQKGCAGLKTEVNVEEYPNQNTGTSVYFWRSDILEDDVEDFLKKHTQVYIYGMGQIATQFSWLFRKYSDKIAGYILSDNKTINGSINDKPIKYISEIANRNVAIIVAMGRMSTEEVRLDLKEYPNVLYLFEF